LTLIGAACQVGFYIKTGTELDWSDAPAFLGNKNSIVVLLSGSWRVLASASFILTLAYFTHQPLYRGFGAINSSIALQVRHGKSLAPISLALLTFSQLLNGYTYLLDPLSQKHRSTSLTIMRPPSFSPTRPTSLKVKAHNVRESMSLAVHTATMILFKAKAHVEALSHCYGS
jgi:hypothetical protein